MFPIALGLAGASPAPAQTITGIVRTRDDLRPATGAIVVLTDSANRPVGGDLTDSLGRFRVSAPRAGRYAIRVERIGLRPVLAPALTLAAGQTVELPLDVGTDPVALRRVRVQTDSRCDVRPREGTPGELAAWLWEEARKALTAANVGAERRTTPLEITHLVRWRELGTERVMREQRLPSTQVRGRPFASLPPESLAVHGYVERHGDSTIYAAPDAATLLDARFLDGHCLAARAARADRPGLVGLAFRPARGTTLPDVHGVLWLDDATFELRFLEFGYTAPESLATPDYGGRVEFARPPDGQWLVQRWTLRVPATVELPNRRLAPAVREEVQELSQASLVRLGLARATPVVTAPSPDSLARLACAGATTDSTGIISGIVRDLATGVPVVGAEVDAEWLGFGPSGTSVPRPRPVALLVRTERDGRFTLCAAPGGALVTLTARVGERRRSAASLVRVQRGAVRLVEIGVR
jgi:hypothetical protein